MKILFIMNNSFSTSSTSEHLMKAVIERLAESGNHVHVLQMLKPGDTLTFPESLLKYTTEEKNNSKGFITTEGVQIRPQKKTSFALRYLHAVRHFLLYGKLLRIHKDARVVFVQSTNVAGVAIWLVRRYIKEAAITYNVQDIMPYNLAFSGKIKKNGFVFSALAAVQRYGYLHSDHIITISEDMKDTLTADGIDADKIEVIYNWSYQDEPYENLDLTEVSDMFSSKDFNVVYAGNIGVMQNVDLLIEAAKLMKDEKAIRFHIIGDGVYREKLKERAGKYKLTNITFWPMQPPELAPFIYSAADINVIPLVRNVYRTALPSKTATCLACQKPVIFAIGKAGRFGRKILRETGCPVIESENAENLVEEIRRIRAGECAINTRDFFLKYFGITRNSRRYADIITGQAKK